MDAIDSMQNNLSVRVQRFPWPIFSAVLLSLMLVLGMLAYSFKSGYQMTAKFTPLVNAAIEIRLEAALAHLWLEEILSGDTAEPFDKVIAHIENALTFARSMVHDGNSANGIHIALAEPEIRADIYSVIVQLELFRSISIERYGLNERAGAGSSIDQRFDVVFLQLLTLAERVEQQLHQLIQQALRDFHLRKYLLLGFCTFLAAMVFFLFYRYEQQRAFHLRQIYDINQRLDRLSVTDGLTGISNRLYFDRSLEREWNRAIRNQTPIALAMLDVDYFKSFNDHYGHLEGDQCLKRIAATLNTVCSRSVDLVARYGGEEFALILPNADDPFPLLNRLLRAVEALQITHQYSPVSPVVTVSIGFQQMVPAIGESPQLLLKAADQALYRAKDQGRNRIVHAADPVAGADPTPQGLH